MKHLFTLAFAIALFAFSGATLASAQTAANVQSADLLSDYRLGAADKVRITVYGEPTLTGEYAVSGSGVISFPLIGDVTAADRTLREVREEIRDKLTKGYLLNPQISAEVLTFRPFYILGEVGKPGEYPYTAGLTLSKAVATAQGFTYRANKKKIYIKRGPTANESSYNVTDDILIVPGDVIRVTERFF